MACLLVVARVLCGLAYATEGGGSYSEPGVRIFIGVLSFRILFRQPTKLTAAHKLEVFLDTDLNAKTGARGAEYVLDYSKSSANLANWHTKEFSRPKSLRFTSTPRSATFRVSDKALGNPGRFSFFVYVAQGSGLIDQVPLYGLREAEWPYPGEHKIATVRSTSGS